MRYKHIAILLLLLIVNLNFLRASDKYVSPLEFGLSEARNGYERYDALLRCHSYAVQNNCYVTYKGLDSLFLEIPRTATGIPLADKNDFGGVSFIVSNYARDTYLFVMEHQLKPISLTKQQIDRGDMRTCDSLAKGLFLVVVEDKKPWVDERLGYGYSHLRQDILLVENGRAKNKVVMPYSNIHSLPSCSYREVTKSEKIISNLSFIRTHGSTNNTGLVKVIGEHNVRIKNIYIHTPTGSDLYGDRIIVAANSTCITYEDIYVDGTYSQPDKFGYAFSLNNVWNYRARRVYADGNWGVYGTNNINKALLEECEINRFDIHCYGRDVLMKNCLFFRHYNSFGSTYGYVKYVNCKFDKVVPYLNSGSYNTFVQVNVFFDKCEFYLSNKKYFLVQMEGMSSALNGRKELAAKYLPNILMKNCNVFVPEDVNAWYILKTGRYNSKLEVEGGNIIFINNLKILGNKESTAYLQSDKIEHKKPYDVKIRKVYLNGGKSVIKQDCYPL